LQEANLLGVDFRGAYLQEAHLHRADFRGANLENARYNLEQFADVELNEQPESIRLHFLQNELIETKQELENARTEDNPEKITELEHKLIIQKQQFDELAEREQHYQTQIQFLLKDRIGKAKESLETSLKTTKERIEHNTAEAKQISRVSKWIFAFTLLLLIAIPFALYFVPPSETIKQLGTFAALLYTLPVVATLLIGTTLLRHHKKLQDEIRHFSDQQQRIELYSGLLEASQHAAAAFHKENNNRAAEELVEETFKAIRSRLLSEQAAATAERGQESDEDPPLLNKLTDIVGKLTEAAAKSGKDDKN
ncbi:MAG: pentapeptide repeat-containing protein, partial [Conchiformibius sp.]|nr:pentapeptide repeat-containing protein [Conchiformibius sp.]